MSTSDKNIKNIAILGSTGSIGTQTLDIIEANPDKFHASVLTANSNWELLAEQAVRFRASKIVIADERFFQPLKDRLSATTIEVASGAKAIAEAVKAPDIDTVVTAMVGYSGLIPTVSAIEAGKTIALANKETLVVAGEIITRLARQYNISILPVDSEHSAIFQCLQGENPSSVKKLILTASGGPFRTYTKEQMKTITPAQALKHPNWDMGAKVTIDSASMMNKGFEMIEARWLFNKNPEDISILVHPQSIVHSMVAFSDGSVKAQIGIPDMHIPIQYALSYPVRLSSPQYELDWAEVHTLNFEAPDLDRFPLLGLAFEAIKTGGNMPCILNAANEVGVKSFLDGKISFLDMGVLASEIMAKTPFITKPSLEDLIETNTIARRYAEECVKHMEKPF